MSEKTLVKYFIIIYLIVCLFITVTSRKCDNNDSECKIFEVIKNTSSKINDFSSSLKGSARFIKNGKFSLKYYKSGWAGGSRGKIKTHNLGKIGKNIGKITQGIEIGLFIKDVYDTFNEEGKEEGKKNLINKGSSLVGSMAGSKIGATVGSVLIPVPILGTFIGGYAGGKLGEKLGNFFGKIITEKH